MATAKKINLFSHPMFIHIVRVRLADQLVAKLGYDRMTATEVADGVTPDAIAEAAQQAGPDPQATPGGIIAAILALLQSPIFSAIITLLLSLFATPTPPSQ